MSTAQSNSSGGGFISKIVVVLLLALAIGLYLRIVMVDGTKRYDEPAPQASMQVLEGDSARTSGGAQLQHLPEDQLALIRRVFAPELER